MTGWLRQFFFIAAAGLWLAWAPGLSAQGSYEDDSYSSPAMKKAAAKKTPGFFRRPARDTAEKQLKHADALLKAGHKKAALKQYYALVCTWHQSAQAAAAQLAYARLLDGFGRSLDAFNEYQYLIDHFAGQFPFDDVLDRQYTIAEKIMTAKHRGFLFIGTFSSPERALPLFEQIVRNGPQWRKAPEAQFRVGSINEDQREYDTAIRVYESLLVSHPASPLAAEAAFRRARCLYTLVNAAPRNEPAYRDALSALSMFLRDFPDHRQVPEAKRYLEELKEKLASMYFERAVYYDRTVKRPAAAVIAYKDFIRNFPTSDLARKASDRIDTLNAEMEKRDEKP